MMANATQIVTLGAFWTKLTASGGRDSIALLDARGTIQVAVWEGKDPPDVVTGHVVSGSGFSRVIKGAEAIWARGAGVQVAVTQVAQVAGYGSVSAAPASAVVDETARASATAAQNTASAAATTANAASETASTAQATASAAQALATEHMPWVSSLSPDMVHQQSLLDRKNWSPKYWTNTGVFTPAQRDLPDHNFTIITTDGADYGLTLAPNAQVFSKRMVRKSSSSDLFCRMVVNTTEPGEIQFRLRNYDNNGGGNALDADTVTIPGTGRQVVYALIPASSLEYRMWVRPGFYNSHASTTVILEDFDIIEVTDWLPIGWLNPPTGTADAQPTIQEAIRLSAKMTVPNIDFQWLQLSVHRAIENTVYASRWRRAMFMPRGTMEDWAGGSTDFDNVPRQKGVVRLMENHQKYEHIRITNPVGYIPVEVITANSVYVQGRCLANGFEDAPFGTRQHATFGSYIDCGVDEYDEYGFRYSSEDGNGFNVTRGNVRKRVPAAQNYNADWDRGYGIILDAGDGRVVETNIFGGEYQIYQMSGGTIEIARNHPWKPHRIYYRRYFGPAGVAIRTGIQVRQASQIGAYDSALVTVTRDPVNWEVIVTPIATITQANATQVIIRADEVCCFLRGFGSHWLGNYFDGGTVRMTRGDSHKFEDGNYGLRGAITNNGASSVSLFEWQPSNTSAIPTQHLDAMERTFGKRAIWYPPISGTSSPTVPLKTFESWKGEYRPDAKEFGVTGSQRQVAGFSAMATTASTRLTHSSNTVNEASAEDIIGSEAPEGSITAPPGSIYRRTTGGSSTTLYVKESGTGNTGWVAYGAGGSGGTGTIPSDVPRTQSTPATGTPATPFLNTAILRFNTTDLPVPIGYLSQVDIRYFGGVMRDFTETATDAQATSNLTALQDALDWSYNEAGIPVLPAGRLDIFGTALLKPGAGIRGQGKHHSHIRQRSIARSASERYADVLASDETLRAGFNTVMDFTVDGGWGMRQNEGAAGPNWTYDIATMTQRGISIRSKAATESNIGTGSSGGVNASLVYGTGTDMHGLIQNVKIQNVAGHGLYLLGRGELQVCNIQIERCGVNGLFTAVADSFYSNITTYLCGNSGVLIKSGASDSRWVNIKAWFCGMALSQEVVGAGYEFADNGGSNINMVNATSQDTFGPGFLLRGRAGISIQGSCDEAGGGRLQQQSMGWTGTRTLPRCFVRCDNTLKKSEINIKVQGGARLTAADYPYLLDLSGSGVIGNTFHFNTDLHDDAGSSGFAMDLAAGSLSSPSRIKANGVLWTNGYANAKRYNEVWFGKRLMHGFVSQVSLDDTTHGVNDAMYGPTAVIRDDGRIMVRTSAGAWVPQGGA